MIIFIFFRNESIRFATRIPLVFSLTGSNKVDAEADDNQKQLANHTHRFIDRYVILTSCSTTSSSPPRELSFCHIIDIINKWMQTLLSHQPLEHNSESDWR